MLRFRHTAFVLVVCAPSLTVGQNFNARNDFLGLQGSEVGWSIEKTMGGYMAFEGYSPDTIPGASVGFTSLDETGVVLSSWSFGQDSISTTPGWANTLDRMPDGGFVSCGATNPGDVNHALVWRFSATGDSLWSTQLFNDSGYASLGWMAKGLADGSVVAVGSVYPPDTASNIFLAKLSAVGEPVWIRTYGGGGSDRGYSLDVLPDNGFVIGGHTGSFGAGALDTYVLRTDSSGGQLWHRWFGTEYDDCVGNVTVAQNGDILVSGCKTMYMAGNNTYLRSQAIRLTPDGDVIWDHLFGIPDIFNGRLTAKEFPDGSFVAVGDQINTATGYPHGSLLKYTADGDSLWMRSYTHPSVSGWLDWHELRDVLVEPDGGITAVGYLDDLTNQDLWVIRVDSFGCLVPGCQQFDNIAEQGLELNILAYPNPTQGKLFLSFRSADPPDGEFMLFNSAGAVVQRFAPGAASVEIDYDISHHPPGMYLLQYQQQGASRWAQRIIKE